LTEVPAAAEIVEVRQILTPALMELFEKMQPSEQAHSLRIYHQLIDLGENSRDLLTAALLHDVGKSRFPLYPWDRAAVVIGQACFPWLVEQWGRGNPQGWKRPFVVARRHPKWGAQMAASSGASTLTVKLILRHQDRITEDFGDIEQHKVEERLLKRLQMVDNES
jgi:predicted HD phosphohydrolase